VPEKKAAHAAAFSLVADILGAGPANVRAGDPKRPMLPHSGIVCRAACAGTWRFAG
jgi:hypothetical protein